jgi:hypothetical protein
MLFRRPSLRRIPFSGSKSVLLLLAGALVGEAQTYKPLFDGKTLKGWHFQGDGSWKVVDGLIVGTHVKAGDHGHLVTDSSFTDFRLHFQWKLSPGGNSGLYFHSQEGGAGGMIGAQLEMDEAFSGGLYSTATNPWGFIYQTSAEDAKKWYKPGDWNDVVLIVDKNTVSNKQNGMTTMNVTSPNLGANGKFGFQLHAGLDMTLSLRNLEWSEVPGPTSLDAGGDKERVGRGKTDRLILNGCGANRIRLPDGFTRAEAYSLKGKRLWSGRISGGNSKGGSGANLELPVGTQSGTLLVRFFP